MLHSFLYSHSYDGGSLVIMELENLSSIQNLKKVRSYSFLQLTLAQAATIHMSLQVKHNVTSYLTLAT